MSNQLVLIDREALLAELHQAFDPRTAEVLLGVLDKVAAQVRAAGFTREDFTELKLIVANLAAAQQRTEQGLEELRQVVANLAAAQQRSEERLTRVELAVGNLAAAQQHFEQHFEQRFNELDVAMGRLQRQVGGLSETVGGDIEDIAYIVLYDVLKREFGWQVGVLERSWQTGDGTPEEVDVFGTAMDPTRPDTIIWIVGEAKHDLTMREVERFVLQVVRARQHLVGEIFPVCFCYRARPEVQQRIKEAGLRLVFSYGKLV